MSTRALGTGYGAGPMKTVVLGAEGGARAHTEALGMTCALPGAGLSWGGLKRVRAGLAAKTCRQAQAVRR